MQTILKGTNNPWLDKIDNLMSPKEKETTTPSVDSLALIADPVSTQVKPPALDVTLSPKQSPNNPEKTPNITVSEDIPTPFQKQQGLSHLK